ncbi:MAG: DNA-directed RNA polymerase subunit beta [Candidatus Parcubacteria bacterium]|nr:MAG: DNA-directed RNA polymerase subunit beta [Candidatus Parcubacteria bacterium]
MFFTKKNFSKSVFIEPENLISFQKERYNQFINFGIKKIFKEFFPISDYSEKELKLEFIDCYLGQPKISEEEAKEKGWTYSAPLRVILRSHNLINNQKVDQEVYFGDIPLINDRGIFIINGNERIIINQFLRSPGVYFTALPFGEKKLFGAKIIPLRGAWLEFQIESNNILQVRIDRRKKVLATTLLKSFGISEEEIKNEFKDLDYSINVIRDTLKKDDLKDNEEALLYIHSKLRSFEPNTFDNALTFFENLFRNNQKYSLSEVGRYHLNRRLNLDIDSLLLQPQDLIAIVKEILRLQADPEAQPDDMDALWNRRIKGINELLENQTRIALMRMIKIIKDKLNVVDKSDKIYPGQFIYSKIFSNAINEFFNLSPLSQLATQVNILSELEHKRRLTASGPGGVSKERAGFEVRDVHPTHYGKICCVQTPEGTNIGLITYQAIYAKINDFGFLETPYYPVKNGKIDKDKIVYLTALEEKKYKIASYTDKIDKNGQLLDELVEGRIYGEPTVIPREEVEFIDISPNQIFSVATNLIPFLNHDDANRAQMGSNMQKQAVHLINPQPPIVSTGIEEIVAKNSGYLIYAEADGDIVEVDASHLVVNYKIKNKTEKKCYYLKKYAKTNDFTFINQKPVVKKAQKVKKGDLLVDVSGTKNGILSLGANILVAFLSFKGYNFEDAIIVSERLLKEDTLTSISIEEFSIDVRETKLGIEETTSDIPGVPDGKLRNLDEEGIVRLGAKVKAGDILVGKITPKKDIELTPEEKLLKAIFGEKVQEVKDTSLYLEPGKSGRVTKIKILERSKGELFDPGVIKRIYVEISKLKKLQVGDKLANRHGNKGVISIILPEEDMPFLPDGRPIDIVLNPLGIVSRMNLGQVLEMHLGYAAYKLGYRAIVPGISDLSEEEIKAELRKANLPEDGKVTLYDGETGEPFKEKISVGIMYIMKLVHMAEDKIHARSIGPYSLITQQPLGGKAQFGGQRLGEMEIWALEAYGAVNTLQEMLTIKSDDVIGRGQTYAKIIKGEPIKPPSIPTAFNLLIKELNSLGLSIEIKYFDKKSKQQELIPEESEEKINITKEE